MASAPDNALSNARLSGDEAARAEADFRLLVQGVEDCAIYMVNIDGTVASWNLGAQRISGYSADEIIGSHVSKFFTPQDVQMGKPIQALQAATHSGRYKVENWRLRKDGSCFWAEVIITALRDPKGELRGYCHVTRDLTEKKQTELLEIDRRQIMEMVVQGQPLKAVLERLVKIIERHCPDAIPSVLVLRDEHLEHYVAPNLPPIFVNAMGKDLSRLIGGQNADATLVSDIKTDPHWEPLRAAAGQIGLETALLIPVCSGKGELLGAFTSFYLDKCVPEKSEIELLKTLARLTALAIEHRRLTDQLSYQAQHDPLTGLPNRVLMEDRLQNAISQTARNNRMVALMFIDLDRFKIINDTLGHEAGDLLLQQVTQRFLSIIRKSDTLVRMGGDEFTLILPDLDDRADAVRVAQKLLDVFKSPMNIAGHDLFVSASIGIGVYPQDGKTSAELQKNADVAMYRAKNAGRNAVECFAPEMNAAAMEKLQLEGELRRAIEQNEFILLYQPQVATDGTLCGFEALLRWKHPKRGMIPPIKFIPIAEDTGLIVQLGTWVIQEACRQTKAWQDAGYQNVKVAVNVSARQFQQVDFVQTTADALKAAKLDPKFLELELTESLLMSDPEHETPKLQAVRELGCGIAIDDFGTGYSSLAYLRKLPIDTLKIDGSFVREIQDGNSKDAAVVQAITSLAHSLGMKVVAEGVEYENQRKYLHSIGCDQMQGYLFGKPKHASEVQQLLEWQACPISLSA